MSNLTALCAINSTIDPSCDCLASGGAPQRNMDISGPGVRISFYLQALFTACLSIRAGSLDEMTGPLYALVVTNVGIAVTALILGFKTEPDISLQDAIVVFYLLFLSWVTLFFSLPSYNRFIKSDKTLHLLSILQSYVLFAFVFAIFSTADHFGKTAPCNPHAVFVIFVPFKAIHAGFYAVWVLVAIVFLAYSALTFGDYKPVAQLWFRMRFRTIRGVRRPNTTQRVASGNRAQKLGNVELGEAGTTIITAPDADLPSTTRAWRTVYDCGVPRNIVLDIIVIIISWALTVMNTELLIAKNNFSGGDGTGPDAWEFGQILSMFLVVIPFTSMIKAFHKYKLARRIHQRKLYRKCAPHALGTRFGRLYARLADVASGGPWNLLVRAPHPDGDLPTTRAQEHFIHPAQSEPSVHSTDSLQNQESSSSTSSSRSGAPHPDCDSKSARTSEHIIHPAHSDPSVHLADSLQSQESSSTTSSSRSPPSPDRECLSLGGDEDDYVRR